MQYLFFPYALPLASAGVGGYIIQPPSDSCGSEMPVAFVSTAIQALCGPVFRLTQLLPGSVTCPSITGLLAALFEGTHIRFVVPVY